MRHYIPVLALLLQPFHFVQTVQTDLMLSRSDVPGWGVLVAHAIRIASLSGSLLCVSK